MANRKKKMRKNKVPSQQRLKRRLKSKPTPKRKFLLDELLNSPGKTEEDTYKDGKFLSLKVSLVRNKTIDETIRKHSTNKLNADLFSNDLKCKVDKSYAMKRLDPLLDEDLDYEKSVNGDEETYLASPNFDRGVDSSINDLNERLKQVSDLECEVPVFNNKMKLRNAPSTSTASAVEGENEVEEDKLQDIKSLEDNTTREKGNKVRIVRIRRQNNKRISVRTNRNILSLRRIRRRICSEDLPDSEAEERTQERLDDNPDDSKEDERLPDCGIGEDYDNKSGERSVDNCKNESDKYADNVGVEGIYPMKTYINPFTKYQGRQINTSNTFGLITITTTKKILKPPSSRIKKFIRNRKWTTKLPQNRNLLKVTSNDDIFNLVSWTALSINDDGSIENEYNRHISKGNHSDSRHFTSPTLSLEPDVFKLPIKRPPTRVPKKQPELKTQFETISDVLSLHPSMNVFFDNQQPDEQSFKEMKELMETKKTLVSNWVQDIQDSTDNTPDNTAAKRIPPPYVLKSICYRYFLNNNCPRYNSCYYKHIVDDNMNCRITKLPYDSLRDLFQFVKSYSLLYQQSFRAIALSLAKFNNARNIGKDFAEMVESIMHMEEVFDKTDYIRSVILAVKEFSLNYGQAIDFIIRNCEPDPNLQDILLYIIIDDDNLGDCWDIIKGMLHLRTSSQKLDAEIVRKMIHFCVNYPGGPELYKSIKKEIIDKDLVDFFSIRAEVARFEMILIPSSHSSLPEIQSCDDNLEQADKDIVNKNGCGENLQDERECLSEAVDKFGDKYPFSDSDSSSDSDNRRSRSRDYSARHTKSRSSSCSPRSSRDKDEQLNVNIERFQPSPPDVSANVNTRNFSGYNYENSNPQTNGYGTADPYVHSSAYDCWKNLNEEYVPQPVVRREPVNMPVNYNGNYRGYNSCNSDGYSYVVPPQANFTQTYDNSQDSNHRYNQYDTQVPNMNQSSATNARSSHLRQEPMRVTTYTVQNPYDFSSKQPNNLYSAVNSRQPNNLYSAANSRQPNNLYNGPSTSSDIIFDPNMFRRPPPPYNRSPQTHTSSQGHSDNVRNIILPRNILNHLGKMNYNRNYVCNSSLHNLYPGANVGVEIDTNDIALLKRCIQNYDINTFVYFFNKYHTEVTVVNFITNVIVNLKEMPDEYDALLELFKSLDMEHITRRDLLGAVIEVIAFNIITCLHKKSQWDKIIKILMKFRNWDSLISSRLFSCEHQFTLMGRYFYICTLFLRAHNFNVPNMLFQSPNLNLLNPTSCWPHDCVDKADIPLRARVLDQFFRSGYPEHLIILTDLYKYIEKLGGVEEFDTWRVFNTMLLEIFDNHQNPANVLKPLLKDIVNTFLEYTDKNYLRTIVIIALQDFTENEAVSLYAQCCKKGIYEYHDGNESTISVMNNMLDPEIKLMLQNYFHNMCRKWPGPPKELCIQVIMGKQHFLYPQILKNTTRSFKDICKSIMDILVTLGMPSFSDKGTYIQIKFNSLSSFYRILKTKQYA